jgi:electron transfer flavoprotein beta subunit
MKVAVAYKWAVNPRDVVVNSDGVADRSQAAAAMSDYDPVAVAVGCALAGGAQGEVVGISVGDGSVGSSLAKKGAMSRGLDRAIVVADDATADWNSTQVAQALAELVDRDGGVKVVVTGAASVDEAAGVVPGLIGGYLGWPCFADVRAVQSIGDGYRIRQATSGGVRVVDVNGPAVISVTSDALVPPVPGMKEILAAGRKPMEVLAASDLSITARDVKAVAFRRPEVKARGRRLFEGDGAVSQLVGALRSDGILE